MKYVILIADDEAEIRDLLRLYLENSGYDVLEAADGLEALAVLEKEHVDLAVLDVMMPRMNGLHVLKKLRETSNIPVLVFSAKDADSDKILGLNLGADDYLTKPFNPLEAVARIQSNIRRFYSLGGHDGNRKDEKSRNIKNHYMDYLFLHIWYKQIPFHDTSKIYSFLHCKHNYVLCFHK